MRIHHSLPTLRFGQTRALSQIQEKKLRVLSFSFFFPFSVSERHDQFKGQVLVILFKGLAVVNLITFKRPRKKRMFLAGRRMTVEGGN